MDRPTENNGENKGVEKVPQIHGGALNVAGTPGNRGGGRPPSEFKVRMRELANLEDADTYLRACLRGEHGPKAFISAQAYVTDRGYGRSPQPVTGEDGGPLRAALTVRFVRADKSDDTG